MKPEVSLPTKECADPERWHCYDEMSAEVEVMEFLAALVKTVKPRLVVETGSYRGLAANHIGLALKEVGRGRLVTCEISEDLHQQTLRQCASVLDVVDCRWCSSMALEFEETIDILFSDSSPALRLQEIQHFWKQLTPASLIVVHDVNSGNHKGLREQVLEVDEKRWLAVVILSTPRGLAICQKREGRE
jgi:predicted O-methyltransferase YrrM